MLGFGVGDHDRLALIKSHPAKREGDDHTHNAHVEQQVHQLTRVAALRRNRQRAGTVLPRLIDRGVPAAKGFLRICAHLIHRCRHHTGLMQRHAREELRRTRRLRAVRTPVIHRARNDAANKGDHQQHNDGNEPGGRESVEKLQPVVDRPHRRVGLEIVIYQRRTDLPLRQQCARNGSQGQQEQQDKRGAHACQPVPRLLQHLHVESFKLLLNYCLSETDGELTSPPNKCLPHAAEQQNTDSNHGDTADDLDLARMPTKEIHAFDRTC